MKMELRSIKKGFQPVRSLPKEWMEKGKALIFMRIILYFDSIKIVFTRPIRTVNPFYYKTPNFQRIFFYFYDHSEVIAVHYYETIKMWMIYFISLWAASLFLSFLIVYKKYLALAVAKLLILQAFPSPLSPILTNFGKTRSCLTWHVQHVLIAFYWK